MASKNLGTVIQRAISDGAFRRQLQSDPAAALRGFNLSPDEIAAVRSGDSSKLMSLGVDQRMSKAFTVGAQSSQASRTALTGDVSGSTSNVLASDNGVGTQESIIGDPTTGSRAALTDDQTGGISNGAVADANNATAGHGAFSTGDSGDEISSRASFSTPTGGATRAFEASDSTTGSHDALSDPTVAGTHSALTDGTAGLGNADFVADDNYSVASRMQDSTGGFTSTDAHIDPGFSDTHSAFIPSDSADVQRELLDGLHGTGDALSNTESPGDTGDEHSWGA